MQSVLQFGSKYSRLKKKTLWQFKLSFVSCVLCLDGEVCRTGCRVYRSSGSRDAVLGVGLEQKAANREEQANKE